MRSRWRAGACVALATFMFASTLPTTQAATPTTLEERVPNEPQEVRARTGFITVSPPIVAVGETLTATFHPLPGHVTWAFSTPANSKCKEERHVLEGEAAKHSVLGVTGGKTTCSWKATAPTHGWATLSAGITGPCGDPEAVRQGKAEYAACAGAHSEDHYYVLSDGYGVSGRVTLGTGKPLAGITLNLSGDGGGSATTLGDGTYQFVAKKGQHTLSASGDVCIDPKVGKCERKTTFSLPASREVNFNEASDGVIEGFIHDSQGAPMAGVSVYITGPSGAVLTTDGGGYYSGHFKRGSYTLEAKKDIEQKTTDASGREVTTMKEQYFCAARTSTGIAGCSRRARVRIPPDQTVDFTPEDDPGLLIAIRSDGAIENSFVRMKVTISNPSKSDVKYLTFGDPKGMKVDIVQPQVGGPAPEHILQLTDGPTPEPPTSVVAGGSIAIAYRYVAVAVGSVVLTVHVEGTSLPSGKTIKAESSATAIVTDHDVNPEDIQKTVEDGIDDMGSATGDGLTALQNDSASYIRTTLNLSEVSPAMVTASGSLELPPDAAAIMAARPELAKPYFKGWFAGYSQAAEKYAGDTKQWVDGLVHDIQDPVVQGAFADGVTQTVLGLPSSVGSKLGYVGNVLTTTSPAQAWDSVWKGGQDALAKVTSAVDSARANAAAARQQASAKAREDPIGFVEDTQMAEGRGAFEITKAFVDAVLGEAELRGGILVAKKVLGPVARGTTRLVGAVSDAVARRAELTRNIKLAEQAVNTIQTFEAGDVLDAAAQQARGGWLPSDVTAIQTEVLPAMAKKFGVEWELGGRMSEVLSSLIDCVPKKQFMKNKAMSVLDFLMGGERSLGGQVSVIESDTLQAADKALKDSGQFAAMAKKVPKFAAEYEARLGDQLKLAKEWENSLAWSRALPGTQTYAKYESSLRFLVDASAKVDAKTGKALYEGGITVLSEVGGRPIPHGLRYLEQLDEAEWVAQKRLTPEQVQAARDQLAHYPDAIKTKIGTKTVGTSTAFIEELVGKPHGSDMDLEFFQPVGGWGTLEPGRRGQAWSEFSALMKKYVSRFPVHLASDNAVDLPSKFYGASVPYALEHVAPAGLNDAAARMVARFNGLADAAEAAAGRLNATAAGREARASLTADPRARKALLDEASQLRQRAKESIDLAAKHRKSAEAKTLLEGKKTGQKVIVVRTGDVRAGYGTGGL